MPRKRLIVISSIVAVIIAIFLGFCIYVIVATPKVDNINIKNTPTKFVTATSFVDYQESKDCSAYATAYVLRCVGKDIVGKELYPKMQRRFGIMTAQSIVATAERQGFSANAYHGNISTLKAQLGKGTPIICLISNGNDTHYVAVVGYDADFIYMADSIEKNANVVGSTSYNRKVSTDEFLTLWKDNFYFVENVYIVIE